MTLDQWQTPILSALKHSSYRPHAPFYAPGHKRGQGASPLLREMLGPAALQIDLPELPELDNLFAPEGVIRQAQALAAEAFGADQTYFLANGSTCGIEAAILATCGPGDKIIVPRNAHRSVMAGLVLTGAMPVFVAPDYAPDLGLTLGLSVDAIATALRHYPDCRAVLVVSPTYHGVCSDIEAIAALTQANQIPLLVDEAHGAHFTFHPLLPETALSRGADLVVQSTHKVLGALSQASMLHTRGHRVDSARLRAALQLTQSTSASYVLLASLDAARQQMATGGYDLLAQTVDLAIDLRARLATLPPLGVVTPEAVTAFDNAQALDLTRLTVDVAGLGITGLQADEVLHAELGVTAELPELRHLTFMVTLGNTREDGTRLVDGCRTLRDRFAPSAHHSPTAIYPSTTAAPPPWSLPQVTPREAFFASTKTLSAEAAVGYLSAETIAAYPPGIPALVAGDVITADALHHLHTVKQQGGYVTGCGDLSLATLKVLHL